MELEDPAFIAALQARDEQAFSNLVRHFHTRLQTVARAVVGEAWVDEVVQEAWVSIYRNLPGFEGRSSLKTWLLAIVRNEAMGRLRKENRMIPLDSVAGERDRTAQWPDVSLRVDGRWRSPLQPWDIGSPEALLQEAQLRDCIRRCLTLLPADQKAVFVLRDLEQVESLDVCNILALSHSNLRVLLHRARMTLLGVIEHYQETGEC